MSAAAALAILAATSPGEGPAVRVVITRTEDVVDRADLRPEDVLDTIARSLAVDPHMVWRRNGQPAALAVDTFYRTGRFWKIGWQWRAGT